MKLKQTGPLFLIALIWGCYYVASQKAVAGMSVFSVGVMVRLITLILLTIIMGVRGQLKLLLQTKAVLPRLLLIGLLGFLLDLTAFIGLTLSPAGSGTALLKCDILFVNLISVLVYKQRFTKKDWLFTIIMLLGVLTVMGVNPLHFRFSGVGDIFFILSALFISINAFVIKSVQLDKSGPVADNVIAYYNNIVTMILFLITSICLGTLGQIKTLADNHGTLLAVCLAGIGQTLIYEVYYYDLRRFPVWIVKVFLLLMPIVASFVCFVLFHETMGAMQYVGVAIVLLAGLGLLTEQKRKAEVENQDVLSAR